MENKPKKSFSSLIDKASGVGKKAAEGIQRGAKSISEQTKQTLLEQKNCSSLLLCLCEGEGGQFIPRRVSLTRDRWTKCLLPICHVQVHAQQMLSGCVLMRPPGPGNGPLS